MSDCHTNHAELIRAFETRVIECRTDVLEEFRDEFRRVHDVLNKAFPPDADGTPDLAGHRKYHEELIRTARAEADFWREMKLDIAKKGAWGLLIILIGLVIIGLQVKLGILHK